MAVIMIVVAESMSVGAMATTMNFTLTVKVFNSLKLDMSRCSTHPKVTIETMGQVHNPSSEGVKVVFSGL